MSCEQRYAQSFKFHANGSDKMKYVQYITTANDKDKANFHGTGK